MVQNHKTVIWNFDFLIAGSPNPPDGYLLSYQAATGLWIPVNVPLGINRSVGFLITNPAYTNGSPYSIQTTDDFLPVDSTNGTITLNLPNPPNIGKGYTIADVTGHAATNNITVAGNGFSIIGSGSFALNTNYQELTVIFNGINWTKV